MVPPTLSAMLDRIRKQLGSRRLTTTAKNAVRWFCYFRGYQRMYTTRTCCCEYGCVLSAESYNYNGSSNGDVNNGWWVVDIGVEEDAKDKVNEVEALEEKEDEDGDVCKAKSEKCI
ncbi:hypothetical protein EGR_09066 [Echinococcus granulosus]|uniref:Uncharacterized protein n=1 Tax=Echinococcus granulosus TaxID=6210 RepID=W6U6U1_ECHGR|nr:hypothetical protein EGR_09066 [Echinococcus granulosus]EUB56076.1 hypothetical protein EGR_09066 [Echinococcus granulosus]